LNIKAGLEKEDMIELPSKLKVVKTISPLDSLLSFSAFPKTSLINETFLSCRASWAAFYSASF
jgi:hypothetical protein